jgi:hypothetical protein
MSAYTKRATSVPRCVVVTKLTRFVDRNWNDPLYRRQFVGQGVKFPALLLLGELIGYYTVEISHLLHSLQFGIRIARLEIPYSRIKGTKYRTTASRLSVDPTDPGPRGGTIGQRVNRRPVAVRIHRNLPLYQGNRLYFVVFRARSKALSGPILESETFAEFSRQA